MPEPTGVGMLVNPNGTAETLSAEEHADIATVLQMLRGEKGDHFSEALDYLLFSLKDSNSKTLPRILATMVAQDLQDCMHHDLGPDAAIYAATWHTEPTYLTDEEFRIVGDTVKAIRRGGWFPDWLANQVTAIADGITAADRCPSPMQIAGTLTGAVEEWETKTDAVREALKQRPDLFPAPATEPKAVPEAPDASKAPAKSPRTHKQHRSR